MSSQKIDHSIEYDADTFIDVDESNFLVGIEIFTLNRLPTLGDLENLAPSEKTTSRN